MAAIYWYREPDEITVPFPTELDTSRFRLNIVEVTQNAEEGSVATSTVLIDDPDGTLDIIGHRIFAIQEDEVTDPDQTWLYVGYTADRKVFRGAMSVEAGRQWEVNLVDINTMLDRRVMVATHSPNRPAETDVARVQWLLSTSAGQLINDDLYVSTANPVAMDAVDYTGQLLKSVIDDCAQQSGKEYFLIANGANVISAKYPWGAYTLWYDFRHSTAYTSTILLSNDLADVDSVTTFAISKENTSLVRDPSRVYSGVYLPYDGGAVYTYDNDTALEFARRDAISPAENVKTGAKAQARAARFLADVATEEDVIKTAFQVPAASATLLRQGMRVPIKATHLPGYETSQWTRVLNLTAKQDSELTYTITVELGGLGEGSAVPSLVKYIVVAPSGSHTAVSSVAASDDGVTWTPIIPDLTVGSIATNLWELTPAQRYRYWSILYSHNHPGGFFAGFDMTAMRLLDAAGLDALGTEGTTPPPATPNIEWPLRSPTVLVGPSVPYVATSNGATASMFGTYLTTGFSGVSPGPVTGDFTIDSPTFSNSHFGLGSGVPPAGLIQARWVWDLGA